MDMHGSATPVLRDYLYLDVDKVKSIAGQLEWGVTEGSSLSERSSKKRSFGWDKAIAYSPENAEETTTQKSMLDSLFPDLESTLEGSWLQDISEQFSDSDSDTYEDLKKTCPEGSIVRITSDNYLLDSRYFADSIRNLSTTLNGFQWFLAELLAESLRGKDGITEEMLVQAVAETRGIGGSSEPGASGTDENLYDFAPNFGYTPDYLRAMIRFTRGLVPEGLNLYSFGQGGDERLTVATRLQKDRRYLDAEPEIVAANFGLDPQAWTIVGTVGHYTSKHEIPPPKDGETQLAEFAAGAEAARFDRGNFLRTISDSLSKFGHLGFLNIPQHPGMTIVPISVYRTVAPRQASEH